MLGGAELADEASVVISCEPEAVTVAVTVTTLAEGDTVADAGVDPTEDDAGIDDDTVADDEAVADATLEDVDEFVVVLPIAAAWNVENWFPGLMAKTIPC